LPRGCLLVALLALLFRLPLVGQGAAGAVTSDGALSGIVSLHVRDGSEHLVFIPHVPYSGSLKSHLTAALCVALDPARAFALASVLFYAGFVAGAHRLALLVPGATAGTALAAGLYLAFSPAYVTRYSLSNDGNYVEVLALGAWALWLAARLATEKEASLGFASGLLLGLAFWSHILGVIHLAAISLFLLVVGRGLAGGWLSAVGAGFVLGDLPGLLWNAANGWESFLYLVPGGPHVGGEVSGPGFLARLRGLVADQGPILFGYDLGYGPALDGALLAFGWAAMLAVAFAAACAAREARRTRAPVLFLLLLFSVVNLGVALLALPYIPGNPRYVLFLIGPAAVFLGRFLAGARARPILPLLIAGGALSSLLQFPGTMRADHRWRTFVSDLEAAGVRHCYTDFYLATKINFLGEERVICSAKLGPTTTEYFFEYRRRVEAAPEAAFVAVNAASAHRLGERLHALGVPFERRDFMKPVLLGLPRKVDPEELYPGRAFPWR
jgi:hypothetical protein